MRVVVLRNSVPQGKFGQELASAWYVSGKHALLLGWVGGGVVVLDETPGVSRGHGPLNLSVKQEKSSVQALVTVKNQYRCCTRTAGNAGGTARPRLLHTGFYTARRPCQNVVCTTGTCLRFKKGDDAAPPAHQPRYSAEKSVAAARRRARGIKSDNHIGWCHDFST